MPLEKPLHVRYHQRMNILNITAQKPDSTGSGIYLSSMVASFAKAGHSQAVIAGVACDDECGLPAGVPFFPVRFGVPDLPFDVVGMSDGMPYPSTRYRDMTAEMVGQFEAAFTCALAKALESFQPDLVICHHLYLLTAIVREALPSATVVAISHGTDIRQMRKHGLERERIIEAMGKLDAIFALHAGQAAEIAEVYRVPSSRIRVLGIGYDHEVFRLPKAPTEAAVDEGVGLGQAETGAPQARIVFVGKMCEKKGVFSLIRALEHVPLSPQGLTLNIVGGHSTPEELERIQRLAAASRFPIEFAGKQPPAQVADAYRQADVFVLPSFYEGLPLVVIEAMACGCKVVVTDLPGIRPWIGEQAPNAPVVYVEPPRMRDADEPYAEDLPAFERRLAEAIAQCIGMPAQAHDLAHLSWNGLCDRLLAEMRSRQAGAKADRQRNDDA